MTKKKSKKVSIIMGSQSDYKTMKFCEKVLKVLKINFETKIVSAHRTPNRMFKYARTAEKNNISIIVAGAGGFIGGHLVSKSLKKKYKVICADIKPLNKWFQVFKKKHFLYDGLILLDGNINYVKEKLSLIKKKNL